MCRQGIPVSWSLASKLKSLIFYMSRLKKKFNLAESLAKSCFTDPKMRDIFHDPVTGDVWVEGDVYFRTDLADTLEKLAKVSQITRVADPDPDPDPVGSGMFSSDPDPVLSIRIRIRPI